MLVFMQKTSLPAATKPIALLRKRKQKLEIKMESNAVLENKLLKITVNKDRGGIVSIIEKTTGREMVDPQAEYAFGQYLYERFDRKQCQKYNIDCYNQAAWDYGARELNTRHDLPDTPSYSKAIPRYKSLEFSDDGMCQKAILNGFTHLRFRQS